MPDRFNRWLRDKKPEHKPRDRTLVGYRGPLRPDVAKVWSDIVWQSEKEDK